MADFDNDLLTGAFADFSNNVAPYVRTSGVDATFATVRKRKRNHAIAAGVLTALVVAVPAIAYAAVQPDAHRTPHVTDNAGPSPAPGASSAAPNTSASPSRAPGSPAPDGRISKAALGNATVDLPAWGPDASIKGCPAGRMTFRDGLKGTSDENLFITIAKVVDVDVDGDGARETVAHLSCGHETSTDQVVAFDRDARGHIRTLGQVVVQTGDIQLICDLRPGAAGAVDVLVGDYPNSLACGDREQAPYMATHWRTYAWTGSTFAQSGGPTAFPVNPKISRLSFRSSDLLFKKAGDRDYRGSMTITIHNIGESAIPYDATVNLPSGLRLVGSSRCRTETFPQPVITVTCPGSALAPGGTATLSLEFASSTSPKSINTDIIPTADVNPAEGYGDLSEDGEVELRIVA